MKNKIQFEKEKLIIRDDFATRITRLSDKYFVLDKDIINGTNHNFFGHYPLLFKEVFPEMPIETIREITLSANLYMNSLLIMDRLIDNGTVGKNISILLSHILHEESIKILNSIFNSKSVFWDFHYDHYDEYLNSFEIEEKHKLYSVPFDLQDMEDIAKGKSAMAKNCSAIYCFKNENNRNIIQKLVKSQDCFHIGLQLVDDLQDWKQDLKNGQYTYILTNSIQQLGWEDKDKFNADEQVKIGKALVLLGIAEQAMEMSIPYFEKALDIVSDFPCQMWKNVINEHIKLASGLCKEMRLLKEKPVHKTENSSHKVNTQKLVENGKKITDNTLSNALKLGYQAVIEDRNKNYINTKHVMIFDEHKGTPYEYQSGDIFQRSLLCETFLDAKEFNFHEDDDFIESEIEYLNSQKLTIVAGGWSYFPNLPSLPPDTDDLAQMIRIFKRGQSKYLQNCEEPICLLLEKNLLSNYAFNTWIVDPDDFSNASIRMRNAIYEKWRLFYGIDVEVTANMILSLRLLDEDKYNVVIKNALGYIQGRQKKDGSWISEWYYGPYYGIYICTMALQDDESSSVHFEKTGRFLVSHQNHDGGWSLNNSNGSDPLSSSLALLSLLRLSNNALEVNVNVLDKAIAYLLDQQYDNGIWEMVPFIRMLHGRYTYQSSISTTNFVLRALMNYSLR